MFLYHWVSLASDYGRLTKYSYLRYIARYSTFIFAVYENV